MGLPLRGASQEYGDLAHTTEVCLYVTVRISVAEACSQNELIDRKSVV